MDKIDRYTDGQERQLRRKIDAIYAEAGRKARAITDEFMRPWKAESERKLKQVAAGELTKDEYQAWLQSRVFTGAAWDAAAQKIADLYVAADEEARAIVGDTDQEVFRQSANLAAEAIGSKAPKTLRTGISFDIYDEKAVERLTVENPQILPEWKIDEPKDYKWNYRRVQNTVIQGIVSGDSVHDIGQRLTGELAAGNAAKMKMFARTALTGANNAGRVERMKEAEQMGIRVLKKWLAVHDARTRDSHAKLDGQTAKPDEDFASELGPIKYPGDPTADPANVYNCRCTLTYVYPDFE